MMLVLLQHVGGSSPLAAHGRASEAVGLAGESKIMIMESSVNLKVFGLTSHGADCNPC